MRLGELELRQSLWLEFRLVPSAQLEQEHPDDVRLLGDEIFVEPSCGGHLLDAPVGFVVADERLLPQLGDAVLDPGQLVDEITELHKSQPDAWELTIIGLLHLMFQKIHLAYTTSAGELEPLDADAALQRRMSTFIYSHYSEKITLDDIAAAGAVSRSKCSKVFKQYLHKSPIDFLNLYRLEVATRLLKNTRESISSISSSCGFGQQSYFNRMFGRTYGCTPREYRDKFANAS